MDDSLSYDEHARRFRRQLRTTLTVLGVLLAINAFSSPGDWWVKWPALGLGIALAFQYKRMLDARDEAAHGAAMRDEATPALQERTPALPAPVAQDDLTRRAEALAERERRASSPS